MIRLATKGPHSLLINKEDYTLMRRRVDAFKEHTRGNTAGKWSDITTELMRSKAVMPASNGC